MDEPLIEEAVWYNFKRGWNPYQIPSTPAVPTGHLYPYLMQENQMVECQGVHAGPDGLLRWHRDQYRIHTPEGNLVTPIVLTGQTLTGLHEFKTEAKNQLLAIYTGGGMYRMTTDWDNATAVKWTYGYQLFKNGEWVACDTGLPGTRPFGFAQMRDRLFIGHKSMATKCWDGTFSLQANWKPPRVSPTPYSTEEDLTAVAWVETDPASHLTVSAAKVTAASMAGTEAAHVTKDLTSVGAFEWRFDFRVTAMDDGSTVQLIGLSESAAAIGTVALYARRVGTKYYVTMTPTGTDVEITLGTTYYASMKRGSPPGVPSAGFAAMTAIFTASDFSDEEPSYTWRAYTYAGTQRYAHLMIPQDGTAATFSGWLEHLDLLVDPGMAGGLPDGNYHYVQTLCYVDSTGAVVWETAPSPASAKVRPSGGSAAIRLKNLVIGPTLTAGQIAAGYEVWRRIYRNYTSSTADGAIGEHYLRVVTINDNTTTTWTDNVPEGLAGDEAPWSHGLPPRGDILVQHNDRLFMASCSCSSRSYEGYETAGLENMLFWSELDEPWYFAATNYIRVGDDSPILCLLSWNRELLILKEHSTWVLRGYDDDLEDGDFTLECISPSIGVTCQNGGAAGTMGCLWEDVSGLMFWNGQSFRRLVDFQYKTWTPREPYKVNPLIAFSRGKFMLRDRFWEPETDSWQRYAQPITGNLGLQAFAFGPLQSHIITEMQWVKDGPAEISVLESGNAFGNADGEGSTYSDWYGQVALTFPPLVAAPGEEIVPVEFEIDGYWPNSHVEPPSEEVLTTKRPFIYLNEDGDYSQTLGENAFPSATTRIQSGQGIVGVPSGYTYSTASLRSNAQTIWYLQMSAFCMANCEIRAVRFRYYRRKRGVNLAT